MSFTFGPMKHQPIVESYFRPDGVRKTVVHTDQTVYGIQYEQGDGINHMWFSGYVETPYFRCLVTKQIDPLSLMEKSLRDILEDPVEGTWLIEEKEAVYHEDAPNQS